MLAVRQEQLRSAYFAEILLTFAEREARQLFQLHLFELEKPSYLEEPIAAEKTARITRK